MSRPLTLLATTALVLAGCATPPQVRVQQADTGVGHCTTFAWHRSSPEAASLAEQHVQAEALRVLESKGYTQSDENPDCRIAYSFSSHEQPRSGPRVGVGAGGGSRGVGGGIGVSLPVGKGGYTGTLTLDVIDADRNAQIWSGTIEAAVKSAEPSPEEIRRDVERILAEFPDRAGS